MAIVTNYHTLGDLKQQRFIISQCWSQKSKTKMTAGPFYSEALDKNASSSLPPAGGWGQVFLRFCILGFPSGSDGKEPPCSTGDPGSIPESGRSPGEGIRYPLQYSCLENPMDRGAWLATGSQSQSRTQLKPFSTHCLIDRTKYSAISYVEICFHSPSLHLPSLPSPCRFPIFLPFFSSSLSTCLLSVIVFFPPGT